MFERSGDRSRRIIVLEMLAEADPGHVLKYDEFIEALSLDPADPKWLKVVQSACQKAVHELETRHKKTIESVRGIGYRIALPEDHVRIGEVKQTRGARSIRRAARTVKNVEWSKLSPEDRVKADAAAKMLANQQRALRNNRLGDLRTQQAREALFPK